MKTIATSILAQSIGGWARGDKITDAIKGMIHYSRGIVKENMTLGKFLDMIDNQEINLSIEVKEGDKYKEIGSLGDNFNCAKLICAED